jgi:ABC-type sugar transport system ATPase subunit
MSGISRSFGSLKALDEVDFELAPGEVMALLGENGAGKSTLVKILAGLSTPDEGTILLDGVPADLGNPRRSREAGIALAAQELSVIGPLSAAENIFLGGVPFSGAWTRRRLARAARPHLEAVGLGDLDPAAPVETLSVAERQLVEIARLLARDARILILDEPTASLSDNEIERVKRSVRGLADRGLSVVYVTHRLSEVFEIADRVTIMRNGHSLPPRPIGELTMATLIEGIIGRPLEEMYPPRGTHLGDVVLSIDAVMAMGLAEPVSLQVRAGEIFGLAGQAGSGNGLVLRAAAGSIPVAHGRVTLDGSPLPPAHTLRQAIGRGIVFCSGDRKYDGIFNGQSVTTNLTAPALDRVSHASWINNRRERELAQEIADRFAIDRKRLPHPVQNLSGGNQQKVVLGKWLGPSPRILLVEEPTRGVDVGARAEIYGHLRSLAQEGLAILFASSDLDEVQGLSDTIGTLFRGRMIRAIAADSISKAELLEDITHQAEPPGALSGPRTLA